MRHPGGGRPPRRAGASPAPPGAGGAAGEAPRTDRGPLERAPVPDLVAAEHLGRRLRAETGVSLAQYQVLELLRDGRSVTPSHVARALGCTRGNVTALASRLAAFGLVERRYDSRDRRRVWLRITPRGLQRLARAREVVHAFLAAWHASRRLPSDPDAPVVLGEPDAQDERWIAYDPPDPERPVRLGAGTAGS